ncbi:Zn-dependent M28 family amino/carboxypeptidase [Mumia flava]|uniref:Zn-dependent M28 family amino/carboxypeptidase n=1 Tax=Mumia flava TaxID=1348852 RepID=A0A2M9AQ89_9ACTN|nr:M28 family metallopeptidase [Mumia flava]PJJ47864.1 Zn-dependent M28 family amino/carboxypeptidase [Mumia flava]
MRRSLIAAASAVALAFGAVTAAPASAHDSKDGRGYGHHESRSAQKLTRAVTVRGIMKHQRAFQRIADANDDNRASGLPGYDASVDYVSKKLRRAGYDVTVQPFTFSFFRELAPAELEQLSPTPTDYETGTFDYSGGGEVTGTVVPIDVQVPAPAEPGVTSGCEAEDFDPAPAEDAVALVQRGSCNFSVKTDNAAAAGYDAVIIFNEGQPGRDGLVVGTLGAPASIPVVGLSYADGAALVEQAEAGDVTVRVSTEVEVDPERTTYNVIADLPAKKGHHKGSGKGKGKGWGHGPANPDEVVVVGAHLDSVAAGPGINDNGSGSSTILEIAEEMADLKLTKKLVRPVRFAFWGAEEAGLLGSEYYVANLSDEEKDAIYANLNFDMLGSPNYVRFVYDGDGSDTPEAGPEGSAQIEQIFTDYFDGEGLASEPTAFDGRSDYGPFIAEGIPAGGLFSGAEGVKTEEQADEYGGTAGEPYDPCYHQACDTIDNLSADALDELGDAAAHAVATLTTSKEGLGTS